MDKFALDGQADVSFKKAILLQLCARNHTRANNTKSNLWSLATALEAKSVVKIDFRLLTDTVELNGSDGKSTQAIAITCKSWPNLQQITCPFRQVLRVNHGCISTKGTHITCCNKNVDFIFINLIKMWVTL